MRILMRAKSFRVMPRYCSNIARYLITKITLVPALIIIITLTLLYMGLVHLVFHQSSILKDDSDDNSESQSLVQFRSISLCVLVRVHSGHLSYLPVLAFSLSQAGFDQIHLYVINIDKNIDNQLLLRTIDMINAFVQRMDYITLLDLGTLNKVDYGYTLTDRALTYLYNQYEYSPCTCQYIILTNGDNFYARELANNILPHMRAKKDIIAWDFVSRYYWPHRIKWSELSDYTIPQIADAGTSKCISVLMELGHVDLGSVTYRLAFLRQHRLHIHYPNESYQALSDGYFVEMASRLTNASILLRQTLFFHQ